MSKTASRAVVPGRRLLHTMLRVRDADASLRFYIDLIGMQLLRRRDFPDGRFTLYFLGYGAESEATVLELTHNWGDHRYDVGTGFGHIAVEVDDVHGAAQELAAAGVIVTRAAGPLRGQADELIAFVEDPDGFRVELIQRRRVS
jgi:lactoylglutathione lyase